MNLDKVTLMWNVGRCMKLLTPNMNDLGKNTECLVEIQRSSTCTVFGAVFSNIYFTMKSLFFMSCTVLSCLPPTGSITMHATVQYSLDIFMYILALPNMYSFDWMYMLPT